MFRRPPIIKDREAYESALKRGFNPLCEDAWKLPMTIELRRDIQKEMFGKNNASGNQKFYKYCLEHKPLVCEECGCPINHPSAYNVSHILTRGAHPEMAHDPRNVNILCPKHHSAWENGDRQSMLICNKNKWIIARLKVEYNSESIHEAAKELGSDTFAGNGDGITKE